MHTVNRLYAMMEMSWAVDGFYSDCVTPEQLQGVLAGTNEMYLKPADMGMKDMDDAEANDTENPME